MLIILIVVYFFSSRLAGKKGISPGLTLALLMLGVGAKNVDDATTSHHLTILTHALNGRSNFHIKYSLYSSRHNFARLS